MLEVSLFCLIEHLAFRATIPVALHGHLTAFAREFGKRASAQRARLSSIFQVDAAVPRTARSRRHGRGLTEICRTCPVIRATKTAFMREWQHGSS
jgi:hypothetical protein